jgi:hypothetical protein
MMIRQRGFRIGQRVKLHDPEKYGSGNAYPLPLGWQDGEEVTVTAFANGWVTVAGDGGKQAEVFIVNIDGGWDEEYAPGKWRERLRNRQVPVIREFRCDEFVNFFQTPFRPLLGIFIGKKAD